jgi:multiple sugar transport system substrate-binding protein
MKLSSLQIIILIVAVGLTIAAVLIFAGILPGFKGALYKGSVELTMWGITLEEKSFSKNLNDLRKQMKNVSLTYLEKSKNTFESELINALAKGRGPDMVIFHDELILKQRDKFLNLSENFITERNFRDIFIDGTEILILTDGIPALPLAVDPLVLYFNRDLFRNEALSSPPKTWDEFVVASQKLTKIDGQGDIIQSGAALGLESNVLNFKEILALLILQTGAPIIDRVTLRVELTPKLAGSGKEALQSALRFFREFSDPRKLSYSWAPNLPSSKEAFLKGGLAMYFGFASEFQSIRAGNPHLNFDVAPVPQIRGSNLQLTYGKFLSVGISRQSKNPEAAWEVMQFLLSPPGLKTLSRANFLSPSRRDLLKERAEDPIQELFFREAVKFKTFLDIDALKTSEIFAEMIKSVYSGAKSEGEASRDGQTKLKVLYQIN